MNRVSIYNHYETGQQLKLLKVGKFYHDQNGKVYPEKEIKCLYQFYSYENARFTKTKCVTTVTVNGFKIKKYVRVP